MLFLFLPFLQSRGVNFEETFCSQWHFYDQIAANVFPVCFGYNLPLPTYCLDIIWCVVYGVLIRYALQNLDTVKEVKEDISAGVISIN
jgi:hypothetical protein